MEREMKNRLKWSENNKQRLQSVNDEVGGVGKLWQISQSTFQSLGGWLRWDCIFCCCMGVLCTNVVVFWVWNNICSFIFSWMNEWKMFSAKLNEIKKLHTYLHICCCWKLDINKFCSVYILTDHKKNWIHLKIIY